MTIHVRIPVPRTVNAWLKEIVRAYCDALETVPIADIVSHKIEEKDLYHLAPAISIKFRGIKRTKKLLDKITGGALSSYIANEEAHRELLLSPIIGFAFCYLASHYALGLLSDDKIQAVMMAIESDPGMLQRLMIEGK